MPALAERYRQHLADEVDFHRWMQWLCDAQLETAQSAARDAGMRLGLMQDLAGDVRRRDAPAEGEQLAEPFVLGDQRRDALGHEGSGVALDGDGFEAGPAGASLFGPGLEPHQRRHDDGEPAHDWSDPDRQTLSVQQGDAVARGIIRYLTTKDPGSGFVEPYPRVDPPGGPGGPGRPCRDPQL